MRQWELLWGRDSCFISPRVFSVQLDRAGARHTWCMISGGTLGSPPLGEETCLSPFPSWNGGQEKQNGPRWDSFLPFSKINLPRLILYHLWPTHEVLVFLPVVLSPLWIRVFPAEEEQVLMEGMRLYGMFLKLFSLSLCVFSLILAVETECRD